MQEDAKPDGIHPQKTCRTCAEAIPLEAKKCNKCQSFQDWRRFFGFGTNFLAMLSVLISVSTALIPPAIRAIGAENSQVSANFAGFEKKRLTIVAANSGALPGTIGEVYLEFKRKNPGKDGQLGTGFPLQHTGSVDEVLIEPGKSKLIAYELSHEDSLARFLKTANHNDFYCGLTIALIQFASKRPNWSEPWESMKEMSCSDAVRSLDPKVAETARPAEQPNAAP